MGWVTYVALLFTPLGAEDGLLRYGSRSREYGAYAAGEVVFCSWFLPTDGAPGEVVQLVWYLLLGEAFPPLRFSRLLRLVRGPGPAELIEALLKLVRLFPRAHGRLPLV